MRFKSTPTTKFVSGPAFIVNIWQYPTARTGGGLFRDIGYTLFKVNLRQRVKQIVVMFLISFY